MAGPKFVKPKTGTIPTGIWNMLKNLGPKAGASAADKLINMHKRKK